MSIIAAAKLSVTLERSTLALRTGEIIGFVTSRIPVILSRPLQFQRRTRV
jgi:hypothetical protein